MSKKLIGIIFVVVAILLFSLETIVYKDSVLSFIQEKQLQIQNQQIYGDLISCINKNENVTLMSAAYIKKDDVLALGISNSFFPNPSDISVVQKQLANSYKNLYSCSLKFGSWSKIEIIHFTFSEVYTVDDGQKQHYFATADFAMQVSRKEAEILSKDDNAEVDILIDIFNGKINYMDISDQNIVFQKTNPAGDVGLALKRYLDTLKYQKDISTPASNT